MAGEKLLRFSPVVDDLPDAVADQERGFRRINWRDKGTIQRTRSTLNFMADNLHTCYFLSVAKTPKKLVAQEKMRAMNVTAIVKTRFCMRTGSGRYCHRGG